MPATARVRARPRRPKAEDRSDARLPFETWALNRRASKVFVAALLNPPEPNATLKAAAARYKFYLPMASIGRLGL